MLMRGVEISKVTCCAHTHTHTIKVRGTEGGVREGEGKEEEEEGGDRTYFCWLGWLPI